METKRCSKCHVHKQLDEFYKCSWSPDGKSAYCKECAKATRKKYHEQNRDYENARSRDYVKRNKETVYENNRQFNLTKRGKKTRQEVAKRQLEKLKEDRPWLYKHRQYSANIATRLRPNAEWNYTLVQKIGDLPYTYQELKNNLESKFKDGMTWENYCTDWTIDHKVPVTIFKFESTKDESFLLCWNFDNLQPLWNDEHKKKGTDFEMSELIKLIRTNLQE